MEKGLDLNIGELLKQGTVIPAHPLALDQRLILDEKRQRALTRYYMAAGAGGVAVGVHTTQFAIRSPGINLLEPVLKMAAEEIALANLDRPFIKVAGICGPTSQALKETELALKYGFHLGLVSMGGLVDYSEAELIRHVRTIAEKIPVFGFYLQPAVGGRVLSYSFWGKFAEIPNIQAIKVAAFNRYQTIDVVRAVCILSGRNEIALYTGNDDNIIVDLLTPYHFTVNGEKMEKRFVGGLLGQWAVWTQKAVALLREIKSCIANNYSGVEKLLIKNVAITDMNAVIFDAQHSFKGCIPGIHEILRRQGLLEGRYCLDRNEDLSEGQLEEINRICKDYASYSDDEFVKEFRNQK
jgi:hypothetical protein